MLYTIVLLNPCNIISAAAKPRRPRQPGFLYISTHDPGSLAWRPQA